MTRRGGIAAIGRVACVLGAVTMLTDMPAQARRRSSHPARSRSVTLPKDGSADWRQVATVADRSRLRAWRQAWIDAVDKAQGGAAAAILSADPALFDPDRALPRPTPPPGRYRCRVVKLGSAGTATRDVTEYPATACVIDAVGTAAGFRTLAGVQRPSGLIFADGPSRAIFLGTLVLGDERTPIRYGQDAARDMAGYVERIGDARWRLVLPRPRFESLLDVIEIAPAPTP